MLDDTQVHIKLLELMGWKKINEDNPCKLGGKLYNGKECTWESPNGLHLDRELPPENLDPNLILEAEEKLIITPSEVVRYIAILCSLNEAAAKAYDKGSKYEFAFAIKQIPVIVCARAILKTLGVEDA